MANDSEKMSLAEFHDWFTRRLSRRTVFGGAAAVAAGALGAGMIRGDAGAAPAGTSGRLRSAYQEELPADAAPADKQVYVVPGNVTTAKVLDFYEKVYERPDVADLFSEPLVRLDNQAAKMAKPGPSRFARG
jgi:hypothetical protein